MEDHFDVYYSTVCNFCKILQSETKFCSGCFLVQYCSKSHQKADWTSHSELCQCIQHILKKTGAQHVFHDAFEANMDLMDWNNLRKSVVMLAEMILKRPLNVVESQICLFPPVCNLCHRYEQKKMIKCDKCNTVMYCSSDHLKDDKKHSDICEYLCLSFEIDKLRYFNKVDFHNLKNLFDPFMKLKKFPENTEVLLNSDCLNLRLEAILFSELLSYTLTFAFSIKSSDLTSSSLSIHVIGADDMEVLSVQTLPVLFHLVPHLTNLKIVMIGPNLLNNLIIPQDITGRCAIENKSQTLYKEYASSDDLIKPDLIIVFNCGFCEYIDLTDKDTWKDSLPYILGFSDCAVVLTSYTAKEADSDLNRLCKMKRNYCTHKVLLEKIKNPFSSLYPHRDWETNNETVFYVNNYISLLKT